MNPYAKSKLEFDDFVMDFADKNNINVVGLRYCNVYGPNEELKGKRASMIYQLWQKMLKHQSPVVFKSGEQKRDWCYVKDVVDANLLAMSYTGRDIFNIGSGQATTFNNIINLLNNKLSTNLNPIYIDNPYESNYQVHTECNVNKAANKLKWHPKYTVAQGILDL